MNTNRKNLIFGGLLLPLFFLLLRYPRQAAQAVRDGLSVCGTMLIPALFPFLVLSSLILQSGLPGFLGTLAQPIMQPVFHVGGAGAAALVLGLTGGYPVGAASAAALYKEGLCSQAEAQKLLAFCCNCSPAFFLSVLGVGVFGDQRAGLLLWAVHILSALLIGLLFRFYPMKGNSLSVNYQRTSASSISLSSVFLQAVSGGLQSCLSISACILCFFVVGAMIAQLVPGLHGHWSEPLLMGFLELTSGISALGRCGSVPALPTAALLTGWGGCCVHCQVLVLLSEAGLSARSYLAGKLLQAILSAVLILPVSRLFSVPAFLAQSVPVLPSVQTVLSRSVTGALAVWLAACLGMLFYLKKYSGKSKRNAV